MGPASGAGAGGHASHVPLAGWLHHTPHARLLPSYPGFPFLLTPASQLTALHCASLTGCSQASRFHTPMPSTVPVGSCCDAGEPRTGPGFQNLGPNLVSL